MVLNNPNSMREIKKGFVTKIDKSAEYQKIYSPIFSHTNNTMTHVVNVNFFLKI